MAQRWYYIEAVGKIIAGWLEADLSGDRLQPRIDERNREGWTVDIGDGPCSGIILDRSELRQALEYAQQVAEPWG